MLPKDLGWCSVEESYVQFYTDGVCSGCGHLEVSLIREDENDVEA